MYSIIMFNSLLAFVAWVIVGIMFGYDRQRVTMSEASEIKKLGAEPVKNSGRSRGVQKGDAVLEPFLVDIKEYDKSFTVSRDNWGKLSSDAITNGRREPMFLLALGQEGQTPIRLWVISDSMGKEMLEAWREKYDGEEDD